MTTTPEPQAAVTVNEPASTSTGIGLGRAAAGAIENVGVLDLTHITSSEQLDLATDITNVGVVLVRESIAARLGMIPMHNVGAVVAVPDAAKVICQTGNIRLAGEALGAPGHEDEALVLTGAVVITSPVERLAYRSLIVVGALVAPRGSEAALSAASVTGSVSYYSPGSSLRMVLGDERYGREFLGYLQEPLSLVVLGNLSFEPDIPVALLQDKVREITLLGVIRAPEKLLPLVQALTVDNIGVIKGLDDIEPAPASGE